MPYKATVIQAMIASPGDVPEYRSIARNVLLEWNYIHSSSTGVLVMPVGWETHSSPELGATPQDLINDRVLADCDLLIGIFWTRIGTPTAAAASGTVEEIQRHVKAGKPAMIYFSDVPISLETVDIEQYKTLKSFRTWCYSQGLVGDFLNSSEFEAKLRRDLQIVLQKNEHLRAAFASRDSGASSVTPVAESPTDEVGSVASTLSPEARSLLSAAAEGKDGVILAVDVLAGRLIQAGRKEFGQMDDRRSMSKWDYGLQQLLTMGLVQPFGDRSKGDKLYQIVERGYQVAERLPKGE